MQPIRIRLERYAASALIGSHTEMCGFFIYHIPDVRKMILSLIRNSIFTAANFTAYPRELRET